jgi:hypothetical protein
MILKRRGYGKIESSIIACELGLVVPTKLAHKYTFAKVSNNKQDWGVHPQKFPIEKFLVNNNIELDFAFVPLSSIPPSSIPDFMEENIINGNDIIVGYDFAEVFDNGDHVGHVSLIGHINDLKDELLLYDPELTNPVTVSIKKLVQGIKRKQDGFWLFGQRSKLIKEYF